MLDATTVVAKGIFDVTVRIVINDLKMEVVNKHLFLKIIMIN